MTIEPDPEPPRSLIPLDRSALSDPELVQNLQGLARVGAGAVARLTTWAVETSLETNRRVLRGLASGEPAAVIAQDVVAEWQGIIRRGLGLDLVEVPEAQRPQTRSTTTLEELRAKGAQLLADSANVWMDYGTHPAYERILDELTPDEARILRLLSIEGPQPAIDIRTNRPLGVGSELVAAGLSMIGLHAGVRHLKRTQAELGNLERLGLVWFSREQVSDPGRYQVVEVQPEVHEAMRDAGRSPRIIRRSIHLTPFGEDFCAVCFPADLD